jgi:formylglycine-generating enzyme required for sulfatase activity
MPGSERFEGVDVLYQLSANGEEIVREGISSSHWFRMMVSSVITGIIGNRADYALVESYRSLLKEFRGDPAIDEVELKSLPKQYIERLPGGINLEMVLIPGGSFRMGSKSYKREQPIHKVSLKPFYMGKYQVTQAEWKAVMKRNPSKFKGDDLPVETVTWDEVQEFCKKLSRNTGRVYRLPSEAEWEYAARAGSMGDFCFGDDESLLSDYAWYGELSGQTHPVGSKKPNKWGLYDVHGNVWEWCEDEYHDNYDRAPDDGRAWETSVKAAARVFRGGSWYDGAVDCRSACRYWYAPG